MDLNTAIKQRLKDKGLLLNSLIEHLDISRAGYHKAIHSHTLKLRQIEKIAEYFKISVPELLFPIYLDEAEAAIYSSIAAHIRELKFANNKKNNADKTNTLQIPDNQSD